MPRCHSERHTTQAHEPAKDLSQLCTSCCCPEHETHHHAINMSHQLNYFCLVRLLICHAYGVVKISFVSQDKLRRSDMLIACDMLIALKQKWHNSGLPGGQALQIKRQALQNKNRFCLCRVRSRSGPIRPNANE
jgi:hypothetical protein